MDPQQLPVVMDASDMSKTSLLIGTLSVYGPIYAASFVLFVILRRRFPKVYNVRNSVPEYGCELAKDDGGWILWAYRVMTVGDDDLYEQCGLDVASSLRLLTLGTRVALVGTINSIWLLPVYGSATDSPQTKNMDDFFDVCGLHHLPTASPRLYATTIGAYFFFVAAMILIDRDLLWYARYRSRWMSESRVDNYTIYVSDLPVPYRIKATLEAYFRRLFGDDALSEVRVAADAPALERIAERRDKLVRRLERAIDIHAGEQVKGRRCRPEELADAETIDRNLSELEELNQTVSAGISEWEEVQGGPERAQSDGEARVDGDKNEVLEDAEEEGGSAKGEDHWSENRGPVNKTSLDSLDDPEESPEHGAPAEQVKDIGEDEEEGREVKMQRGSLLPSFLTKSSVQSAIGRVSIEEMVPTAWTRTDKIMPRDAAFVTFSSLKSMSMALMMQHNIDPWVMRSSRAPPPQSIRWGDVGPLNKRSLAFRQTTGKVLNLTLILFYTVPLAFVSSLFEVNSLKEKIPWLAEAVAKNPHLQQLLAQVAPILLALLFEVAKIVMFLLCQLEGHIAAAQVDTGLFNHLAMFQIVQNFLVLLTSGSFFAAINFLTSPKMAIEAIAAAVPASSGIFVQIVLVQSFLGGAMALLRVTDILDAKILQFQTTSVQCPPNFNLPMRQSYLVFQFLALLVYATMIPFASYAMLFSFILFQLTWRHHAVYIYPPTWELYTDSGGDLWPPAIKSIVISVLIAEVLVTTVLSLKGGTIPAALMTPLVIWSTRFAVLRWRTLDRIGITPCALTCIEADEEHPKRGGEEEGELCSGTTAHAWEGAYLQPALQQRRAVPKNLERYCRTDEEQVGQQSLVKISGVHAC